MKDERAQDLAHRYLGTSAELRSEMSPYFDAGWFLSRNPDIRDSGLDPLAHYLVQGHREGRNPSPFFDTTQYRERHMGADDGCPLVHYVREGRFKGLSPHPLIDPEHLLRTYGIISENLLAALTSRAVEIDSLNDWFTTSLYARLHPDVQGDPFEHFATAGLAEGRRPHPGFAISRDTGGDVVFRHTRHGGEPIFVVRTSLPQAVIDQVLAQGAIEPAVFAPGYEAIPHLPQRRSCSVIDREGFDPRKLLESIGHRPDALVIHPALTAGGADKYMAQLVQSLQRDLTLRTLVLTTRATEEQDNDALSLQILEPLRHTRIVSLQSHFAKARDPGLSLALLMLALRPKHAFVINSERGLEAVSRFGRPLASAMKMLVSFFSESPVGRGAWFPTRYLNDVIQHATVFADNRAILDRLSHRLGHQARDRFVLMPQSVDVPDATRFERMLADRRSRAADSPRVLWMSRWRPSKATDVLEKLAMTRPDIAIDVYGVDESAQFPAPPNLVRHPVVRDPETLPLHAYDAFIFTSRFEGMPNVVLEMAGRGIPVIASDVGGLRETLDDSAIDYISMTGEPWQIAGTFGAALDRVRSRRHDETEDRLRRARAAVEMRHSSAAFAARLREVVA